MKHKLSKPLFIILFLCTISTILIVACKRKFETTLNGFDHALSIKAGDLKNQPFLIRKGEGVEHNFTCDYGSSTTEINYYTVKNGNLTDFQNYFKQLDLPSDLFLMGYYENEGKILGYFTATEGKSCMNFQIYCFNKKTGQYDPVFKNSPDGLRVQSIPIKIMYDFNIVMSERLNMAFSNGNLEVLMTNIQPKQKSYEKGLSSIAFKSIVHSYIKKELSDIDEQVVSLDKKVHSRRPVPDCNIPCSPASGNTWCEFTPSGPYCGIIIHPDDTCLQTKINDLTDDPIPDLSNAFAYNVRDNILLNSDIGIDYVNTYYIVGGYILLNDLVDAGNVSDYYTVASIFHSIADDYINEGSHYVLINSTRHDDLVEGLNDIKSTINEDYVENLIQGVIDDIDAAEGLEKEEFIALFEL